MIDWSRRQSAADRADARLAAEKAAVKRWLVRHLEDTARAVTGDIPGSETLSWTEKEAEARAVLEADQAGTPPPVAPLLAGECAETGETLGDLAARVAARAELFRAVQAGLTGLRRSVEARLDAARTPEDLHTIRADADARAAEIVNLAGE